MFEDFPLKTTDFSIYIGSVTISDVILNFDPPRALPYAIVIVAFMYWNKLRKNRNTAYAEFIENSPGIAIDTSGVTYGVGHGFDNRQALSNTTRPP